MPVSSSSALVVIVTDSGLVRDTVIRVSEELDSDALYAISRRLTEQLGGFTLAEAAAMLPHMTAASQPAGNLLSSVNSLISSVSEGQRTHVAVGGASNMLSYPEYSDMEKARHFVSLIETRDKLANIIAQHGEMAFTVRIGPETGVPEMSDCSIVTATYSTRSGQQGTIGVIGPTRMQYSRVLSILGSMGSQLSAMFDETSHEP